MKKIIINSYVEAGYEPIPGLFLSDDEFARGLQCFVPVCTDAIPINRERKTIYLAPRKSKPMPGPWGIGGKMNPSETKEISVARCFKRETKLTISIARFILIGFFDYFWKDRQQEPQNIGCHMAAYTYAVELSEEELASVQLDKDEYAQGPFKEYTREDLVKENLHQVLIDFYDAVFGAV